jgi:TATA-box binding protein (TBP) (component of TFIID and TFIIIB)
MSSLNSEWENFTLKGKSNLKSESKVAPTYKVNCSDIYISTKTKIAYLNIKNINLTNTFWDIPIIDYHEPSVGVLKKSMKFNCTCKKETDLLEKKIQQIDNINVDVIKQIITNTKYKDVKKIDIGISKKDLTNFRKKKKGAFYNCFALIIRIKENSVYKEVHIKIFNTGKLEIPGIQNDNTLYIALNHLCKLLTNILKVDVYYDKKNVENVLINSNFSCGFYVDRQKLHQLLKFKYNIHSLYDPCSYPGIQCKFYYNDDNINGICKCKKPCYYAKKNDSVEKKCKEISFMIFRTGSVLIVGHCNEKVLYSVYEFLKNIFVTEYNEFGCNFNKPIKKKKNITKIRKKKIKVSIND